MSQTLSGRITIAPQVLTTVVAQTALAMEGVRGLGARPSHITGARGRKAVAAGVEAVVADNTVTISLIVDVAPGVNMMALAAALQQEIAHNIEHILGMQVARVDVTIGDVVFP